MVLASKVHSIPLKFLSKEGQNSTLRAAGLDERYDVTSSGQAAKYDSKWRRALLNFGPLWRGISVGLSWRIYHGNTRLNYKAHAAVCYIFRIA